MMSPIIFSHSNGCANEVGQFRPLEPCNGEKMCIYLVKARTWLRSLNTTAKCSTILLCHISPFRISHLPNFPLPGFLEMQTPVLFLGPTHPEVRAFHRGGGGRCCTKGGQGLWVIDGGGRGCSSAGESGTCSRLPLVSFGLLFPSAAWGWRPVSLPLTGPVLLISSAFSESLYRNVLGALPFGWSRSLEGWQTFP